MKKRFWVMVALCLALTTGCATVQKKFTRKKKTPKHIPAVIYMEEPGAFQKKYSNDYYYRTHYTLWKSWHDDLMKQLGGNRKKTARNAQEALNHLLDLPELLQEDKRKGLEDEIVRLRGLVQKIETGYIDSEAGPVRVELEGIRRRISNDYYYEKIKDSLLADEVGLENEKEPAA